MHQLPLLCTFCPLLAIAPQQMLCHGARRWFAEQAITRRRRPNASDTDCSRRLVNIFPVFIACGSTKRLIQPAGRRAASEIARYPYQRPIHHGRHPLRHQHAWCSMKITNRIAPIIQSAARGLLFLLLLLSPLPGYSQSLTGLPPFGTFQKSAPGTTNLGNLNDHYEIPIRQTPGRVLGFSAAIELDTAVWYSWANPTGGDYWVGGRAASVTTNADGLITDTTTPSQCPGPPPTTPTNIFSNFVYIDRHNTSHNFPGAHFDTQNCQGSVLTAYSLGYKLVITNPGPSFTVTVYDSSGIAPNNYSAADPNGNRITTFTGPGTATDSTGNGVLTFGISGPNRTYTYTGPNGVLETYQLNYTSVTLQTNFGCQYVHDQSPVSVNLLTSIQLPDGSSYVITYEQTPGFSANYTGRIASI